MVNQDELPERFFIITNQAWPATRNALQGDGRFASAAFTAMADNPELEASYDDGSLDHLPYRENSNWLGRWTPPARSSSAKYQIDHDAEVVRRKHFAPYPSRFSAVFAFADEESCERVEQALSWNQADRREFRLLPGARNRVVRLNMHTFTAARNKYMTGVEFTDQQREELWLPYWSGQAPPMPISNLPQWMHTPLWEYLIDGVLELVH